MELTPEEYVGIRGYASKSPGFRGSIKSDSSDFVVEELPLPLIERSDDGKYTYLKVQLTDWDTNRFLVRLARDLHISRKRISYAGTKDKKAVTVQYFCVNSDIDPGSIRIGGAEILESFRSDHFLRLGDLVGNRFTVRVESDSEHGEEISRISSEVEASGGFPNFFGMQRFGSIRINTHRIGRCLVHGEYSKAVEMYIYDRDFDTEDYRVDFGKTHDAEQALERFPMHLNFERSLLAYIAENGSLEGAFSSFPRNLGMLFVHAYQSYLFNRMLSERLERAGDLLTVFPGDVAVKVDRYFNPVDRQEIKVNGYNTEKIGRLVGEGRLRATIPLIGFESSYSKGFQGEIERKVMEEEGLAFPMFRISGYPELSSKGSRRVISAIPVDFKSSSGDILKFSLGKGIYATSYLREFLKNS